MINLDPEIKSQVINILRQYLQHAEIRLVGSRVRKDAKPYADIDLLVISKNVLTPKIRALLNTAFEESDIPFKVDVLDHHDLTTQFRTILIEDSEPLISIKQYKQADDTVRTKMAIK